MSAIRIQRAAIIAGFLSAWRISIALAADLPADEAPMEVVVEGERPRSFGAPKDRNLAGSVIERERLEAPGLQAADVLRTQPGVVVTESGGFGAPSTAAIRGATAEQTPVYLAGIRLNDDVGGTADLSLIPLWLIDRVEVYRGNAPIEADRMGIGGAIFFEPRRPSKFMGGAGLLAGSYGTRGLWAYQGMGGRRASALVGVRLEGAKNDYPFINDQGTLFDTSDDFVDRRINADTRLYDAWGIGRVWLNDRGALLDIVANATFREQGLPRLALLPSQRARSQEERALFAIRSNIPFGEGGRHSVEFKAAHLVGTSRQRDPLHELSLGNDEVSVSGARIEQTVGANVRATPALRIRPVVNLAHEKISRSPRDIPLDRARRVFMRTSVGADWGVSESLALNALGAGECHYTGVNPGDVCDILEPTGRVGAKFGNENIHALANVSRYVRVPTLGETYGVSGVVRGNEKLLPESGSSLDLGLRARTRAGNYSLFVDAFVFGRLAEDLVAYKRTAQGYVVPYNVGEARVLGSEILLGASYRQIVTADIATTLLDPQDISKDRTTRNAYLPYRSRMIVVPRLRAESRRLGRYVNKVLGELRYVYQSNRYADPAGLALIDDQGALDFEAEGKFVEEYLSLRMRVANLLNQRRTDVIGYPLPGRSVFVGMEARW